MALHLPSHSTSDAAERNLPTGAESKEGVLYVPIRNFFCCVRRTLLSLPCRRRLCAG